MLKLDGDIQKLAAGLKDANSLLLFGRGYNYATALEAALKVCLQPCLHQHFTLRTAIVMLHAACHKTYLSLATITSYISCWTSVAYMTVIRQLDMPCRHAMCSFALAIGFD